MPPGCRLSSTVSSFELLSREFFYPGYLHMKALNYALTCTHDLFQMPWSWTIVGTAFLIRTLVNSPFYFYSEKNLAKVLHISLDCARTSPMLLKKLESSASYKQLDPSAAQKYFKKMNRRVFLKTCEGNHCHPFKSAAAAVIQIPFWLSFSFTLRYMCGFQLAPDYGWNYVVPGMITEGLTVACTNAVLPVMVLLAGLANVELVYLRQLRSPESITDPNRYSDPFGYKLGRGVGWFVNGLVFSAAVFLPKAMVIYWCTSSVHQFLTHLIVMHPGVRKRFGIWLRPHEGERPYRMLFLQIRSRYRLLRYIYTKRTE